MSIFVDRTPNAGETADIHDGNYQSANTRPSPGRKYQYRGNTKGRTTQVSSLSALSSEDRTRQEALRDPLYTDILILGQIRLPQFKFKGYKYSNYFGGLYLWQHNVPQRKAQSYAYLYTCKAVWQLRSPIVPYLSLIAILVRTWHNFSLTYYTVCFCRLLKHTSSAASILRSQSETDSSVELPLVHKALFKLGNQGTSKPVTFTVKIQHLIDSTFLFPYSCVQNLFFMYSLLCQFQS